MSVGDQQRLITAIVATVLGEEAQTDTAFHWLVNKHTPETFGIYYPVIHQIFDTLQGNFRANQQKAIRALKPDAYFGGSFNFMFEFDEYQHFSTARTKTLELYPNDLSLSFDLEEYKQLCRRYRTQADKYRAAKKTADFDFVGGRTAQRAYLDSFRDLLPSLHGLRPTLRISEFEVISVTGNNPASRKIISDLIEKKIGGASIN